MKAVFLAVIFFAAALQATAQDAPVDIVTVQVTGQGETRSEARLDAIRQATQYATKQLVVAERLIEDDKVVLDRIYSTMNGFVEDFDILSEGEKNGIYELSAEVSISRTRIGNFVRTSSGTVQIVGGSIFAERQRLIEQNRVHEEMLAALFRRFPQDVLIAELTVENITLEHLHFTVEVSWDDGFLSSLRGLIDEIFLAKCPVDSSVIEGYRYSRYRPSECQIQPAFGNQARRLVDVKDEIRRRSGGFGYDVYLSDDLFPNGIYGVILDGYVFHFGPFKNFFAAEVDDRSYVKFFRTPCQFLWSPDTRASLLQVKLNATGSPKTITLPEAPIDFSRFINIGEENVFLIIEGKVPLEAIADESVSGISASVLWGGFSTLELFARALSPDTVCTLMSEDSNLWRKIKLKFTPLNYNMTLQ